MASKASSTIPVFYTKFDTPPKVLAPTRGASMTKQSAFADTDVNAIIAKYRASNYDPHFINKRMTAFGDFSHSIDLASALKAIDQASDDFSQLPATVREHFGNDPASFFNAFKSPDSIKSHQDLFVKSGIMRPLPTPTPTPTSTPTGETPAP